MGGSGCRVTSVLVSKTTPDFCQFYIKTYVLTSQLNRLDETIQMRDQMKNKKKTSFNLSPNTPSYPDLCVVTPH